MWTARPPVLLTYAIVELDETIFYNLHILLLESNRKYFNLPASSSFFFLLYIVLGLFHIQ